MHTTYCTNPKLTDPRVILHGEKKDSIESDMVILPSQVIRLWIPSNVMDEYECEGEGEGEGQGHRWSDQMSVFFPCACGHWNGQNVTEWCKLEIVAVTGWIN